MGDLGIGVGVWFTELLRGVVILHERWHVKTCWRLKWVSCLIIPKILSLPLCHLCTEYRRLPPESPKIGTQIKRGSGFLFLSRNFVQKDHEPFVYFIIQDPLGNNTDTMWFTQSCYQDWKPRDETGFVFRSPLSLTRDYIGGSYNVSSIHPRRRTVCDGQAIKTTTILKLKFNGQKKDS